MAETTLTQFLIRHYQEGEESKMVELVNACRASESDGLVTVDMIRDEWHDSRLKLERDTWVAVDEQGSYIAAAEVWFNDPDNDEAVVTRHVGFALHPAYRDTHAELLEQLLAEALTHATTYPLRLPEKAYVLRAWASAKDSWKHGVILAHGFQHVHSGYTMLHDTLGDLPPVPPVAGVRIEAWDVARDRELWQALNEGFSTDPTYSPLSWEDWQELYHAGRSDQGLWRLAIDAATNEVVGLALTEIDQESNQEMGRADGWVVDLAVVERWRGRGLGRALLLAALHALRDAGMSAVKLGLDATDPSRATRLYDSLGFQVMQGSHTYHRPLKK